MAAAEIAVAVEAVRARVAAALPIGAAAVTVVVIAAVIAAGESASVAAAVRT